MRALWSADPPQQTDSFLAADSSVVWTLENSPDWSERLHFPNLQGHRHEGASREPLFVSEGESQSTGGENRAGAGRGRGRPPAFDQFASYSFAEVFFFMQMGNLQTSVRKYVSYICPNRWCFLTWERSQPRTCLKSLANPPPHHPSHPPLRVVNSTLNVQVWTVPFLSQSFRPVRGFARSPKSILTPN